MNDKQAKRVRRLAEEVHHEVENPEPKGSYLHHRQRGYVANHPLSLRGIIRRIKKEVRSGAVEN